MPIPVPQQFPRENVIQFEWQGKNVRLINVATSRDSLSGVPIGQAGCDSTCRVSYPISVLTGATRWAKPGSESKTFMSMAVLVPLGLLGALVLLVATGGGWHMQ